MKPFIKLIQTTFFGLALALVTLVPSFGANSLLEKELKTAEKECGELENGVLRSKRAGVKEVNFIDAETPGFIVHYGEIDCSSGNIYWCGNGGCSIVVLVGGKRYEFFARDYQIKQFYDSPIVIFAHHGLSCGGAGSDPCFSMAFWNGETFVSATTNEND